MMRHMMLAAIAALAATGAQALTTCGTNAIAEVQAGAISLPREDVTLDHVPSPSPPPSVWIGVQSTQAQFIPMALVCKEPPGPLTRCEPVPTGGTWYPNERLYIVVEARPDSLACGTFSLDKYEE